MYLLTDKRSIVGVPRVGNVGFAACATAAKARTLRIVTFIVFIFVGVVLSSTCFRWMVCEVEQRSKPLVLALGTRKDIIILLFVIASGITIVSSKKKQCKNGQRISRTARPHVGTNTTDRTTPGFVSRLRCVKVEARIMCEKIKYKVNNN